MIKAVYNVKSHPDVVNGRKTEDEALNEFLETFEMQTEYRNGIIT